MTDAPDSGPANRPGRGDTAVQLEDLRTNLSTLRSDLDEVRSDVSELAAEAVRADALTQLASKVESVDTKVQQLAEYVADSSEAGAVVTDWSPLSRADAWKLWQKLWQWLATHYLPRWEPSRFDIPDCWTRHPAMRDTLAALYETYKAGRSPGALASTAAQWDTVWHRHYLQALRELANRFGCEPGICRGTPTDLPRVEDDDHRSPERHCRPAEHWLTDGITADLDTRPESPAEDEHAETDTDPTPSEH